MKTFFIIIGSFILLGILSLVGLFFYAKKLNKIEVVPASSTLQINDSKISQHKIDTIAKYIKNYPDETQLSIAFVNGDSVTYYGTLRKNGVLHTVKNSDSVFHIGSITKVFTSTLLSDFIIHKKVDPQIPIQEYCDIPLHSIEKEGKHISLQTLSNHTSGLPRLPSGMMMMSIMNPDNPYQNYTQEKLDNYLKEKMKPETTPGTTMAYSNLGAGLLGNILANIENKTYEELLQERIFSKYHMTSSSTNQELLQHKTVSGLTGKGNPAVAWSMPALLGAGGILSTTEDLSKFAIANFKKDSILDFQRKKTFEKNKKMSVALGWMIITKNDKTFYFHNGAVGGYLSSMILDTENKKSVIILSNVNHSHPDSKNLDKLCFALAAMD